VRYSPHWQAEFKRLSSRMPENVAIVAIARKLLVVIWHVLTQQVADKHADEQRVAAKLMRWSWGLTQQQRGGLSTRLFVRRQLMRLQLADDLTHFTYGGMPRRIASVQELLAACPDLRPPG